MFNSLALLFILSKKILVSNKSFFNCNINPKGIV